MEIPVLSPLHTFSVNLMMDITGEIDSVFESIARIAQGIFGKVAEHSLSDDTFEEKIEILLGIYQKVRSEKRAEIRSRKMENYLRHFMRCERLYTITEPALYQTISYFLRQKCTVEDLKKMDVKDIAEALHNPSVLAGVSSVQGFGKFVKNAFKSI